MAGRGLRRTLTISEEAKSDLKPADDGVNNGGGGGNDSTAPKPGIPGDQGGEPAKMSLMALFEQAEGGGFGSGEEGDEGVEDEEEEEDDDDDDEELYHACCVCMVRHKGEPFEPCGHTFCRLCSREMLGSEGNCPLCNGYILEILNIF